MRRVIVFFLLFAGLLFGDELGKTYVLAKKNWEPSVGMRVQGKLAREILNAEMKVTVDGNWSTGKISSLEESEIILSRPSEDAYLLRFERDTGKYRIRYAGEKSAQRDERPFHKKTIQVDREGDEWVAMVTEGNVDEVNPDELEMRLKAIPGDLFVQFDYAVSLLGTQPRKVGEIWEVELPLIPGMAVGEITEGKAKLVFEKVEEVRGHQCAILKLIYDVKIDFKERGGGVLAFAGEGKVVRSLAMLFDLEFEAKGILKEVQESDGQVEEKEGKCTISQKIFILPPVKKE